MNEVPKVSVIMSCFNAEETVSRAIESILDQTFQDLEFIIVDDASTDRTYQICQEYARRDQRILLFRRDENSGFCAAPLNMAIRHTQAEIIARMDADDYSYPSRLEKQYAFLLTNPDVDILGTNVRLINKKTDKGTGESNFKEKHEDIIKQRYVKPMLAHPTIMVRKQVYVKFGGYNEDAFRVEDIDLWLRAFSKYTFHNLQEVLYDFYRRQELIGLTDFKVLRNTINVYYLAMKRNNELYIHWPILVKQIFYFLLYNTKRYFRG